MLLGQYTSIKLLTIHHKVIYDYMPSWYLFYLGRHDLTEKATEPNLWKIILKLTNSNYLLLDFLFGSKKSYMVLRSPSFFQSNPTSCSLYYKNWCKLLIYHNTKSKSQIVQEPANTLYVSKQTSILNGNHHFPVMIQSMKKGIEITN